MPAILLQALRKRRRTKFVYPISSSLLLSIWQRIRAAAVINPCIEFCQDDAGHYRFNCAAMRCIDSREYCDKKIDVNQNHMNNSHLPSASDKAAVENPLPPAFPMKPKRGHYQVIDKLLILHILINVACLGYYLFVGYQFRFHSDSAAANLLAQEIYETGQYFPREWNYVFGDPWGVFMQTWIVMLLPFFPNGYAVHAMGSIVGCIFTGLATWGVCTLMGAVRGSLDRLSKHDE